MLLRLCAEAQRTASYVVSQQTLARCGGPVQMKRLIECEVGIVAGASLVAAGQATVVASPYARRDECGAPLTVCWPTQNACHARDNLDLNNLAELGSHPVGTKCPRKRSLNWLI